MVNKVNVIFDLAAQIADKEGGVPLNKHNGCWVKKLDEHWTIAINGHGEPKKYNNCDIPPYTMYVEFNGFPAGIVDPFGGVMATGELANEDALIAILKSVLGEAEGGGQG